MNNNQRTSSFGQKLFQGSITKGVSKRLVKDENGIIHCPTRFAHGYYGQADVPKDNFKSN